jgi:hypothetical protein
MIAALESHVMERDDVEKERVCRLSKSAMLKCKERV